MKAIIVWLIHTPAGTIALVAAVVALFATKGGVLHRKAGAWFTVAMLVMLVSGFAAAAIKTSVADMLLSAVVIYTVFTAWLTTHRKNNQTGLLELAALAWIIAVAIVAASINIGGGDTDTQNPYLYWVGFAVICVLGDIRNLYWGLTGAQRIIRHVWRIGFSLLWAALAFTDKLIKMQGADIKTLPQDQVLYIVAAPALLILAVTLYWIIAVLFFERKKLGSYLNQVD